MRAVLILVGLVLSGCTSAGFPFSQQELNSVHHAVEYIGYNETEHREELKILMEVDPVTTEWCAAFVNAILTKDSKPNLYDLNNPAPLLARSFLNWGEAVEKEDIQQGDLVIFPRGEEGWQGHVGFYVTEIDGYWIILGGNQNKEVSYARFNPNSALGIRRYVETEPEPVFVNPFENLLKLLPKKNTQVSD